LSKKFYEIKIEVTAQDEVNISNDFKILKIREFSFNQFSQLKRTLSPIYWHLSSNYRTLSEIFLLLSEESDPETRRKIQESRQIENLVKNTGNDAKRTEIFAKKNMSLAKKIES